MMLNVVPNELTDPLAGLPQVAAWQAEQLDRLGMDTDPRFSPLLTLAFTVPELAGEVSGVRFVGVSARSSAVEFPWEWLDGRPLVIVSLGTMNADAGREFLTESVRALAGRPDLEGIVVGDVSGAPNVLVQPEVPFVELVLRANTVVCHGGHNTVCESLSAGVPLVIAPIRDDQPIIAQQVVRAGAGERLRFGLAKAVHVAAAVDRALTDTELQGAAQRMRAAFASAGGAPAAADALEEVLVVHR